VNTVVVVPTYNEAPNIAGLIRQVLAVGVVTAVIVVDDNSPDGTGQIVDELLRDQPDAIYVCHRAGKLGLGTAYITGFDRALELGADRIVTMDADFSHKPSYIPALVAASQRYDLAIGSRYVRGGGTLHWGLHRQMLSRGANLLARSLLGLRAHDCTAGLRCYRVELLRRVNFSGIRSNGYSFLIEMLYHCQQADATIGEVPIIFEDRQRGTSKISQAEILRALGTVWRMSLNRVGLRSASVPLRSSRKP
jgi:dolichol-phosphate mannosyltransferase